MKLSVVTMTPEEIEGFKNYMRGKHPNANLRVAGKIQDLLIIFGAEPDEETIEALRYVASALEYGLKMYQDKLKTEAETKTKHMNN